MIRSGTDQPGIFRIAERILPDLSLKSCLQFPEKIIRNLLRNRNLVDIDTYLPAVQHLEEGDFPCGVLQVRIFPDHAPVSCLSAQFQGNRGQVFCRHLHHMGSDLRRSCIEDLVKPLLQAQVRNVMTAIHHSDIVFRESFGNQPFQYFGAGYGLGTDLDNRGVSSRKACRQNAQGKQNRKIERADNQRNAIGHLINPGDQARKARQSAEMHFRPCPSFQPADYFVYLHDCGADIAEKRLRAVSPQILVERVLQYFAIVLNSIPQFFQRFDSPGDRQCLSGKKEFPLVFNCLMNALFHPFHPLLTSRSCQVQCVNNAPSGIRSAVPP